MNKAAFCIIAGMVILAMTGVMMIFTNAFILKLGIMLGLFWVARGVLYWARPD